jgi:hypothetical protein
LNNWNQYERKRYALEKKWRPKIYKALQDQLSSYTYPSGDLDQAFNYSGLIGVLRALYADAGARMAKDTLRELQATQKAYNVVMRTKFRGIGGGEDFARLLVQILQLVGLNLAQKMAETTKAKVREIILFGVDQGWSIEEISRTIRTRVTDINRSRSLTIARTEVGRASNEGKLLSAMAMGIAMNKEWLTAKDERVRRKPRDKADHLVMHGQAVELDRGFDNGMQLPGDHTAPPEQTVNCRCTLIFRAIRDKNGMTIPKNYLTPVRSSSIQFAEGLSAGITIGSLLD